MSKELFLYTAKDCELCVDMQTELQALLTNKDVVCHIIDIGDDPVLGQRYGARVPVLVSANEEVCEVKLDVLALETFLLCNEYQI